MESPQRRWFLLRQCTGPTRTKIKLVHEAASGLILLKAKPDECAWLREALKQELDVPQDVKDSLYQILIC